MTHECDLWTLLWRLAPRWLCRNMWIIWWSFPCMFQLCVSKLRDLLSWQRFKKERLFIHPASINLHRELISHPPKCRCHRWPRWHLIAQMLLFHSLWDFEKCVSSYWDTFECRLYYVVKFEHSLRYFYLRRLQKFVSLHLICV